jgi:hypothetical protein
MKQKKQIRTKLKSGTNQSIPIKSPKRKENRLERIETD